MSKWLFFARTLFLVFCFYVSKGLEASLHTGLRGAIVTFPRFIVTFPRLV